MVVILSSKCFLNSFVADSESLASLIQVTHVIPSNGRDRGHGGGGGGGRNRGRARGGGGGHGGDDPTHHPSLRSPHTHTGQLKGRGEPQGVPQDGRQGGFQGGPLQELVGMAWRGLPPDRTVPSSLTHKTARKNISKFHQESL